MPAPAANRSRFSLTIKGVRDEIRVTGFSGHAEISSLYTYDISIASKRANFDLKSWLDQPATLTLHGDPDRHIHGLIMEASHTGQGREFTDYRITIVPRLWRLTQSKNNRIFQDKTANQIITLLMREHGITGSVFQDHTLNAPSRSFCVQFGESDFAFVSRLMDEEGWHFHFHQQKDNHILVMADKNKVFASKAGSPQIRYEQETSRADGVECIHRLDHHHKITTGAVRLGDFDFTKPGLALRECQSGSNASLEHYDHPGLFDDPAMGKKRALLRLEQAECQRQSIRMETHATTLDAGQWFQLHSHPNGTLNGQYLVTRVAISGTQSQAYGEGAANNEEPFRCSIDCIPWQTEFRPPHGWRKPTIKGPHSAIVTGPKGEEIYIDQHGRIKVQFHWDREGQADDTTSCWVRVNQPVSGIQWGGISIPRVGQEVIVEFEHGDPDRPIVVGRVYNGQSQPPYPLPQHKTRSVLKTLSSPGGGGYHEIRIEDKKGSEQIFLRAEKDADLRVLNQRRTFIGNNQHATIGNADFSEYNGELHQTVGAALNEQIGQNLSVTVGQELQIKVNGAQVTQVGNAVHIKVGSKAVIQGGMSLSIKAGAGFITLDPSGVSIMGPLVRINQGGGGGSAQAANPTLPGAPAEPDNAIPGAKLRPASGPITPIPEVIDFDKARAQLATFQQANTFVSPLVEECPECLLAATRQASPSTSDDVPEEYATAVLPRPSPPDASIPWETSIWMDTPFYEKAFVATGYLFDQLNDKLKSVSEWHDDTVKAFDTIGEDPATPEPLRFATALLKLPARISTGLVSGVGAIASLITNPDSRTELADGIKTLYENPEMLVDAAKAFADKPAYEQASDVIVLASDVALGGKAAIKSGGKLRKADALDARKKALGDRIAAKRVVPDNLTDAKNILAERRKQIAANGYQPKYSDEELKFIAERGNIGSERYQVRFMETKYLDPDNRHLSGAMGRPMEGKGAKYWSTSFDQLEDADTDPKLISEKLGLTHDPQKNYTLVIVDTQKATPITGVKSVSATFENVSDFANTELPAKFPKSFTDTVMTPEFQAEYAKHYKAAEKSGYLKKEWSSDKFSEYLNATGLSEAEKELMIQRFDMHEKIGNNEDYLGNGLTKNNNSSINKQYGVVETLNFERKKVNLSQLDEIDAITLLPGLKPI